MNDEEIITIDLNFYRKQGREQVCDEIIIAFKKKWGEWGVMGPAIEEIKKIRDRQ